MQIEQSVLSRAVTWLLEHQGPQGEFREMGRLIHTEMQGGLDNGPVALTAYVLMALLEDENYMVSYGTLCISVEEVIKWDFLTNFSVCHISTDLLSGSSV